MNTVQTPARLAAAEIGQVRITGVMARNAELRITAEAQPRAVLCMQVETGRGFPYRVAQDCGTSNAEHRAAAIKAALLRRGAVVTVYARGSAPRTDHGHAVINLEGVTDVIPETPPSPTKHQEH